MSDKVYIVGVGSTALGRFPDKSVKQFTTTRSRRRWPDAGAEHGRYRIRLVLQHASGDDGEPEHDPRAMRAAVDGVRDNPDHQRRERLLLEFHRPQPGLRRYQGRTVRGRTRGRRREDVLSGQEGSDVQGVSRRLGRARDGAHAKASCSVSARACRYRRKRTPTPASTACSWTSTPRWHASTCGSTARRRVRSRLRPPRAISTRP